MQYGTWIHDVRAQEKDKGVDFYKLACYASKLTPYIKDRLSYALRDLEQLYLALPADIDGDAEQREYWEASREEYIESVRTALCGIAAALAAVGCTDEELAGIPKSNKELPDAVDDDESDDDDDEMVETIRLEVMELREKAAQAEKEKEEHADQLT